MATKKTEEVLYDPPQGDIYIEDYPGCCGIQIATGFTLDKANPFYSRDGVSLSGWHQRALKEIARRRRCRNIQISLVTKYKSVRRGESREQVPGFVEFLKGKGWKELDRFINPNHGNEVTVLSKTFPKKRQPKTNTLYGGIW